MVTQQKDLKEIVGMGENGTCTESVVARVHFSEVGVD